MSQQGIAAVTLARSWVDSQIWVPLFEDPEAGPTWMHAGRLSAVQAWVESLGIVEHPQWVSVGPSLWDLREAEVAAPERGREGEVMDVVLTRQADGAWLCQASTDGGEFIAARRTLRAAKQWGRMWMNVPRAKWTENGDGSSVSASAVVAAGSGGEEGS